MKIVGAMSAVNMMYMIGLGVSPPRPSAATTAG